MQPRYRQYPPIEPYNSGFLDVGQGHKVYFEESGNPAGIPVLTVHGGPGYALGPSYRRRYNPKKWRIIYFDQRGCGRSTPFAEIKDNTTQRLIEDIEKLRKHLAVQKWVVTGFSWGATLSLLYAQAHPANVLSLVVGGVFLGERDEIDWFFSPLGLPRLRYKQFCRVRTAIGDDSLWGRECEAKLYKLLTSKNTEKAMAAVQEWCAYESMACHLFPKDEAIRRESQADANALAIARLELHYFQKDCFLTPNQILTNAHKISHIPTYILQGKQDLVCPSMAALKLAEALPKAKLIEFSDGDHWGSTTFLEYRRQLFESIHKKLI